MVIEGGGGLGDHPVAAHPAQPAVDEVDVPDHLCGPARGLQPGRPVQPPGGPDEPGDHPAVPAGDDLVVARGCGPVLPHLAQHRPGPVVEPDAARTELLGIGPQLQGRGVALEAAGVGDPEHRQHVAELGVANHLLDLRRVPDVVLALAGLAEGVG
ncbi:hypothetical protein SDC9_113216 [bioreactor metagenome]|uniref:Uncharacterized protein n=1 Tax=bioreactor metagenome TaxID=1076179 RepID=A0A645BLG2_9ZZZZ